MLLNIIILSFSFLTITVSAQTKFPAGEQSRTLNTSGHSKSKGVNMQIDFPLSWTIEEARRPNTIAIAVSEKGRGLENCVITIHTIEQLGWSKAVVAAETPKTFASPERLLRASEDSGGKMLDGGPANIEGLPSRWFETITDVTRDGRDFFATLTYQIIYGERLITVGCGVGRKTENETLIKFKRLSTTTFRIVINSILLTDRWK